MSQMSQMVVESGTMSDPTDVTCPVCGITIPWVECMTNMHGTCCSAECAAGNAVPAAQMTFFPPGELPCWILERCKQPFSSCGSPLPEATQWRAACTPTTFG
jgi:hypothetical protein